MTSHSAVVKRFGCREALLWVTFLYPAHPCAAPFGRLRRAALLLQRACTSKEKVTRRKAKAFALNKKAKTKPLDLGPPA
ncbi:hypothetical protein [[Pseudomonas] boreopolis]|uniref:hypothetical protein n=1 Tax=Xanthomonas boreopolis TaxID=86183 RepID=UPI003DA00797